MRRKFYLCAVVYGVFLVGLFFREGVGLLMGPYERIDDFALLSHFGRGVDVLPGEVASGNVSAVVQTYQKRGGCDRFRGGVASASVYRDAAFWYIFPDLQDVPFWVVRKYGIKIDRVTGKVFAPGDERGMVYGYLAMPVAEVEAMLVELGVKDGRALVEKVGVPWVYRAFEDEEGGKGSVFEYRAEKGILYIVFEEGKPPVVELCTNVVFV